MEVEGYQEDPSPSDSRGEPPATAALSCAACRQRKVKCDKNQPCGACKLRNVDCLPPVRTSDPNRRKRNLARRTELERRLLNLEGSLSGLVGRLGSGQPDAMSEISVERENLPNQLREPAGLFTLGGNGQSPRIGSSGALGRSFWIGLIEEFNGLRSCLDNHSANLENSPVASDIWDSTLGTGPSLQSLQLPKSSSLFLIDTYFTHVDPLLKMVPQCTIRDLVIAMSDPISHISRAQECLLLSIFYTSISSLSRGACNEHFGVEQSELLSRYQHDIEVALKKADLLNGNELMVLQSLIIYLTTARLSDSSRSVWTLTGLATRIAFALDLHRDNDGENPPTLDAEVRRRTWWQVYHLEWRASEDRGSDPGIHEHNFNTALPLNINDIDLVRGQELVERRGLTDMTFSLVAFEACSVANMLNYVPPKTSLQFKLLSLKQRDAIAKECCQRLQIKYFTHCDSSIPYQRFILLVGQVIMGRIRLSVHYPLQRLIDPPVQSKETRDSILKTAVELLESAEAMESDKDLSQWSWLAKTHIPWHAFAVVLAELCVRPNVPRAWAIVEVAFPKWAKRVADMENGALWRPLLKLYAKAQSARQEQVQWSSMAPGKSQHPGTMGINGSYTPSLAQRSSQSVYSQTLQGLPHVPGLVDGPLSIEQLYGVPETDGINQNSAVNPADRTDHYSMIWDELLQDFGESRNDTDRWHEGFGDGL